MSQADHSQKALALKQASEGSAVRTILRMPQVEEATGLKQSHIYHLISKGKFPRPIKLASQAVGWFADEVLEWQQSRPRAEGGWSPRDRKRQVAISEAKTTSEAAPSRLGRTEQDDDFDDAHERWLDRQTERAIGG